MNPRSIRFRLIMWYAGLLTGAFILFGIALYQVLRNYLENSLAQLLIRRSDQPGPGSRRTDGGASDSFIRAGLGPARRLQFPG